MTPRILSGYCARPYAIPGQDPELRKEFVKKLAADSEFAGDAQKRLQWFYEKTPFFDHDWNVYPVAREM